MRPRPVAHPNALLAAALLLSACRGAISSPTAPAVLAPTVRPAPGAVPAVSEGSDNLALARAASASASLADQQPSNAVDGDLETTWGAGSHPPQWIEIDLGQAFDIERLTLIPSQSPEGPTVHQVWGRGDAGESRLLHELRGSTADGVALGVSPIAAWAAVRYLRVETTESPSWVAWREIEVFGSPAAAGSVAAGGPPDVIFHNGNLLTMEEDRPIAEAIAILGDTIVAVGGNDEVLALAGPGTAVVDLQGRTLTPGFIDAHQHRIGNRGAVGIDDPAEVVQLAIEQGWTSIDELNENQDRLDALIDMGRAGVLRLRVDAYLAVNESSPEGSMLGDYYQGYAPGQVVAPNLRVAGLKIFTDFNNATILLWQQQALNDFVLSRLQEGWPLAIKTVSTRSLEMILKAVDFASATIPDIPERRIRLEHMLFATPEQIARIKQLGMVPVINLNVPGQLVGEADVDQLIAREPSGSYAPWRSLEQAGILIANATGWPSYYVEEPTGAPFGSPMHLIYQAVTRVGNLGTKPYPWLLDQAITSEQAMRALTIDGAYASFEDDAKGSLSPGKLADLVILSQDPLSAPAEQVNNIKVWMTMVGGQVQWCAPEAQALCPGQAASAPATAVPEAAGWPVLSKGSQGPEVVALPYLLRHHGQDIPADGLFGSVTEQAVKNFQSQAGLVVDGLVGGQTWPALVQGVVLQRGSSGDAVRAAQVLLLDKFGYADIIVVDGLFGRGTEAVVKTFQADHGLTSDGMVGASQTWPALISIQP